MVGSNPLKLQLLQRGPQLFWIGPSLSFIIGRMYLGFGANWGWDKYDVFSLLPQARIDRIQDGRAYVVSWAGFNITISTLPLTSLFRMEAARNAMARLRLIEWNR